MTDLKDTANRAANPDVVALIPAAGHATRIGELPCSKEVLPLGTHPAGHPLAGRPKVLASHLLEKLHASGVHRAWFILRTGKWDIPACFGDGSDHRMHVGYLMQGLPYGVPYTLDQAFPYVERSIVALGFPDILFDAERPFAPLIESLHADGTDVALGLFPADDPQNADAVETAPDGLARRIWVKPHAKPRPVVWSIAVWGPAFSQFLHAHLKKLAGSAADLPELHVGHCFQAAIDAGLRVGTRRVSADPPLDVGTPENLELARRRYAESA